MKRGVTGLLLACVVIIAAGSAAPAPKKAVIFFPAPPALPRIQYLTSYSGSRDIEQESGFRRMVVGEIPKVGVNKPYGVAIYDGKIYVCDTNSTVVYFDLKNKAFLPLSGAVGAGKLIEPFNISIDEDGNKYVTDVARGQVLIFDRNDAYVNAIGQPGAWQPLDAVRYQDNLYVADAKNRVVDVFDMKTWQVVKKIGHGADKKDWLDTPTNLAFDDDGYLYVSDALRFDVVKFDRDGHFIMKFGRLGNNVGNFARPKGIAVDKQKRLFAVDAAFNNVQIFDKTGRLLTFFGGPGPERGNLVLPAKVTIDYKNVGYFDQFISPNFAAEYLVIVTSQFGPARVNVFAFGKEKGVKYPTEEQLIEELKKNVQKYLREHPEKAAPAGTEQGGKEGK